MRRTERSAGNGLREEARRRWETIVNAVSFDAATSKHRQVHPVQMAPGRRAHDQSSAVRAALPKRTIRAWRRVMRLTAMSRLPRSDSMSPSSVRAS